VRASKIIGETNKKGGPPKSSAKGGLHRKETRRRQNFDSKAVNPARKGKREFCTEAKKGGGREPVRR